MRGGIASDACSCYVFASDEPVADCLCLCEHGEQRGRRHGWTWRRPPSWREGVHSAAPRGAPGSDGAPRACPSSTTAPPADQLPTVARRGIGGRPEAGAGQRTPARCEAEDAGQRRGKLMWAACNSRHRRWEGIAAAGDMPNPALAAVGARNRPVTRARRRGMRRHPSGRAAAAAA